MYDLHAAVGGSTWGVPAGRISYQFDLRGPSMGVEATCATSLLAVHLACRALVAGEIDMAIVGGANLLLAPDLYLGLSDAGILSPTGRSRFGDAGADGYVRSEGVVTLILKPLSQALRDGDQIYASILGTAATNNGRTAGTLFASSEAGQDAAIRTAYAAAGVRPGDIDYVEAHGPGTPAGDPAELGALGRVLAEGRPADRRCLVGSVKSNIGHLEAAAGLAGLLKVALALRHRTIPMTLHVQTPNPAVTGPKVPLELVRCLQPWPDRGRPGLAGISSFGLSGTNVHAVLAEAVPTPPVRSRRRGSHLLALSARDPGALRAAAHGYVDTLDRPGRVAPAPADVCFSAGARRSHLEHRLAVVGSSARALADGLRAFHRGDRPDSVLGGERPVAGPPQVVFVFPGQGSQWPGMGRALLTENRVFARRIRECGRVIEAELGWSLVDRLAAAEPLSTVSEIQPAVWAVQVALAAVWQDLGIRPDLVIGHSMGEIAAATAAGSLTLADAGRVVCRRSALLRTRPPAGEMWAVQVGEREALEAIGQLANRVGVGAINSNHATVLSGDPAALAVVVDALRRRGVFCRQVQVDYASHAAQVEPLRPYLLEALAGLRPRRGSVPMYSTALDRRLDGPDLGAGYWADNLRLPVRFAAAVGAALAATRPTVFIEVAPHPVLRSAIEDGIEAAAREAIVIPSLHRGGPETESLLTGLGQAYVFGCDPDWARVTDGRFVPVPTYPWQRRRYWAEGPAAAPATPARTTALLPAGSPALAAADRPHNVSGSTGSASTVHGPTVTRSAAALAEYMAAQVSEVLGLAPVDVDLDLSPARCGLDSVLATRLRNRLVQELKVQLPVRDLLSTRTLSEIATDLYERARGAPTSALPRVL
jgi:acyl transferase domain-containing protein